MRFRKYFALALSMMMLLSLLTGGALGAGGYDVEKNSGSCPSGDTHHWVGWYDPPPWCTTEGTVYLSCDKCGERTKETVPALGHDWGSWTTVKAPTCTEEGTSERVCNRCGATETSAIPALGHDMGGWTTTNGPTCTDTGTSERSCSRCGLTETSSIPALGHDWNEKTIDEKDPTCTEKGYRIYQYYCTRCGALGDTHTDTFPELGHDFGSWKTDKEPWCEEKGQRHRTCKRCGYKESGKINALGHDWDDGVVTRVPTPEKPGEMTYTCKRDPSHTYTVEIPYEGVPVPPPVTDPPVTDPPVTDPPVTDPPEPVPSEVGLTLTAIMTGTIKSEYEAGEPISFHLILTNDSSDSVELPSIHEYWVENAVDVTDYSDSSLVLGPGESYETDGYDTITPMDVVNGQLTFEFTGKAYRQSDGLLLLSNPATLTWLTKDTPVTFVEDEFSLQLDVYPLYPKPEYVVDGMGDTEEIPYIAQVTNTGNAPLSFQDLMFLIDGVTYCHTEPVQYLMPNDSYTFYVYGTHLNETQITPGTDTATTLGIVYVTFEALGFDESTGNLLCTSNPVTLDHTLVEIGPWDPGFSSFEVKKVETSSHINPKGYMLNETITYDIYVTNTGTLPIAPVEVCDDHYDDGGGGNTLTFVPNIDPMETVVIPFSYTVTQADVDAGEVINVASVLWMDPVTGNVITATAPPVKSPTTDEPLPGGLEIVKSVTSTPANGAYYTPDETIQFHFTVTNTMDVEITSIVIYDAFFNTVNVGTLAAHASYDWTYDYTATDLDASIGYVYNIAYGGGYSGIDWKYATSNDVYAPVHFNPPPVGALKLTKTESSVPANGVYYVLGEEIVYTITVENIGEAVLYDICLFDSLDNPLVEYAHFGILSPGEKQSATYQYTVTQEDVDTGYVENWAIADFWVEGDGTWYSEYAGPVYSPTSQQYTVKTSPPFKGPGKNDSCKLTLTSAGGYTLIEEQHFCATHKACLNEVMRLVTTARTDAEKAAAWQQGAAIWREAVNTEYAEMLNDANGLVRLTIMEDQAEFDRYLEVLEAMLKAVYPDNPAKVSETMCKVLSDQCTELCYLHHNAGKARPDSMYSRSYKLLEGDTASVRCIRTENLAHGGDVMVQHGLCNDQGKAQNTVLFLAGAIVNRSSAEDTFHRTRRIWQTSLDQMTNLKYRAAADDATRQAIAKYRMELDQLLQKRSEMLAALYPANPEIVAEVISNIVRNLVFDLCELW